MSNYILIFAACGAMLLLTVIVAVRLLKARIKESTEKRLHPQTISNSVEMALRLQSKNAVQAADNFRNLCETPILFYTVCLFALFFQVDSSLWIAGAWGYVALRYLHSYIHCTYNKVMHRLYAFLASFVMLILLWLGVGLRLL